MASVKLYSPHFYLITSVSFVRAWRAAVPGVTKNRTRLSDWAELKLILPVWKTHTIQFLLSYFPNSDVFYINLSTVHVLIISHLGGKCLSVPLSMYQHCVIRCYGKSCRPARYSFLIWLLLLCLGQKGLIQCCSQSVAIDLFLHLWIL